MSPEVRNYDEADREACRALWTDLTQHHRDLYDSQQIGGDDPGALFDEHLAMVGPARIWVAAGPTGIIGMVGMIEKDGEVELEPIVVSPEHRGSGVGRALAQAVFRAAADLGVNRVTTRPVARNDRTLSFFHDLGFTTVGQLELIHDFDRHDRWRPGLEVADATFDV